MKCFVLAVLPLLLATVASAQTPAASPRSVWIADYSPDGVKTAVAAGKTTLIYSGGSSMAVANHVEVARYVARRVAEELGNALVLPIVPTPARAGSAAANRGSDGPFEIVTRAVAAADFKEVFVVADEGAGPADKTLEQLVSRLDAALKPKGVPVHHITAHELRPGQDGLTFNGDYLRRWAVRTIQPDRRKPVEDAAELLYVDPEHRVVEDGVDRRSGPRGGDAGARPPYARAARQLDPQ